MPNIMHTLDSLISTAINLANLSINFHIYGYVLQAYYMWMIISLTEEISKKKTKYSSLMKRNDVQNDIQELEALTDKIKDLIDRCNDPLVQSSEISVYYIVSSIFFLNRTNQSFHTDKIPCKWSSATIHCYQKPWLVQRRDPFERWTRSCYWTG